ncbi:TRAP transporter fused permease subunit [Fusibacter paucivorans]|uniref:TRAP transporter fused permease subunit n=1 Tax=Fusibacter paucivorans TaxID=76009 RepID=A0ABS5PR38_9FIRM|nr:TRAP transporter fused permease subunit [Fusibacter paucivorans]MBS7527523.1 TRAP transporter fused permease subunit [Fusibacter paucivorans]
MSDKKLTLRVCFVYILKSLLTMTSLIYLYTAGFGVFSAMTHRALLITLLLPVAFFIKGKGDNLQIEGGTLSLVWRSLLAVLLAVSGIYIMVVWKSRVMKIGATPDMDIIMGGIMILTLLELTRRRVGKFITLTAVLFLLYTRFGPYFPSVLAHSGESWRRIIEFLYMTTEGIFGIPLGIASTFIIVFVIFGAFLSAYDVGQWFIDVAFSLTGKYRGGPAKTAIAASGLMGMISGSSAANVATTGTFTIPLMKRTGYMPHYAASIEAVASTAGLFTPPIMGAGAFIMAEYLNVPYKTIAMAAVFPATLFYLSLFLTVDSRAKKMGIKGLSENEIPNFKKIFTEKYYLSIPVIFMITFIMMGWSPMKTAFGALMLTVVIHMIRVKFKISIAYFVETLQNGAIQAIPIIISCAAAGIIVGTISMTGLGAKLSYTLIDISNGNLAIAGVVIALITLVLGCAMPPTAVYIILASILVPPMVDMGVTKLAAHLFIFMYASLGALTPPVAITAYTAAAIAESEPNKTGFTAFRLGLAAYLMPFKFLFNASLLMVGPISGIVLSIFEMILIIVALVVVTEGYFIFVWTKTMRVIMGMAAMMLITAYPILQLAGAVIVIICFTWQYIRHRVKAKTESLSV